MSTNFSKSDRRGLPKQGQTRRPSTTKSTNQKLSREQLIFRIETLREKLDENPGLSETQKTGILQDIANYAGQLDKL